MTSSYHSGSKSRLCFPAGMGSSSSTAKTSNDPLASEFDRLSLNTPARIQRDHVPGRKLPSSNDPEFPVPSIFSAQEIPMPPKPPAIMMPVPEPYTPQSRTMEHALAASQPAPLNTGNPLVGLRPPRPHRLIKPHSDQAVRQSERLSPPLSPPGTRARSAPTSPAPRSGEEEEEEDVDRCHSRTRYQGNPRCKNRRSKAARVPLEEFESGFRPNFYCSAHLSQQLRQNGFYSSQKDEIFKISNHIQDGFIKYAGTLKAHSINFCSTRHRLDT
jgi:hypothetical protein